MGMRIRFCVIILLSFVLAASASAGERIMFVGNSLTGFNNLPSQVLEHAREAGFEPEIEEYIHFGKTLAFHLKRKEVIKALETERWDVVVLQEFSVLPLDKPVEFEDSVMRFERLVRSNPMNAKTRIVLFQNWPLRDVETIRTLDASYGRVANLTKVEVAPVGRAWNEARKISGADLYVDERHPSALGSYVAMAVITKSIFGTKADSLSHLGSDSTTSAVVNGPLETAKFFDLDRDFDPAVIELVQAAVDATL
jgi:hypothetical protein